ncbi:MAG: phosphatase [Clostridiaceae bacterium]|nr:phosphatase [Clostridiaceae bacterium]
MRITVDTHTHTSVSHHAYHTLDEMLRQAGEMGLEGIAITNHGPALGDGAHPWHFSSMSSLEKEYYGVRLLKGAEANIISYDGQLDLEDWVLKRLDLVIASYHEPCVAPSTVEEHTRGLLNVMDNPHVDIIGHMGNETYKCNYEAVVKKAKEAGKIIEINSHSFVFRKNSDKNCREIALLCKKHGVNIVVSSDAHAKDRILFVDKALKMLDEINFPEELVLNTSLEKLISYLQIEK